MDKKGYYKILGITDDEKKLSSEEFQKICKKKYHELSLKYHPDRHVNDSEEEKKKAEEKFKEISEAYSILGDEQKRKEYDSQPMGGGWGGFDPFDIFNSMAKSRPRYNVGDNAYATVNLTFKEAYTGTDKYVHYKVKCKCEHCNGTGSDDGKKTTCSYCGGTGRFINRHVNGNTVFESVSTCPHCGGTGQVITNLCKKCNGKGYKEEFKDLKVTISAGVFNGLRTSIEQEGSVPLNGPGINGDLILTVQVQNDSYFERPDNINIIHYTDLTIAEALLGCEKEFKYPDGTMFKQKFHECTKDNEPFIIKGKGFPDINGNGKRGDYAIVVRYKYPTKLSNKQKEALKDFNK